MAGDIKELKNASNNIPDLESTYARLFVIFLRDAVLQDHPEVSEIPINSAIKLAAKIRAETTQTHEKLYSSYDSATLRSITTEALEELKKINTNLAKEVAKQLTNELADLSKKADDLDKKEDALKQNFDDSKKKILIILESVVLAIATNANPDEKANSQDILNQLSLASKTRRAVDTEIEHLRRAQLVSNSAFKKKCEQIEEASDSKVRPDIPQAPTHGY